MAGRRESRLPFRRLKQLFTNNDIFSMAQFWLFVTYKTNIQQIDLCIIINLL